MNEVRREKTTPSGRAVARRAAALLAAVATAALLAAALIGCAETTASDPLVGYWIGGSGDQMTMVQIGKDGDQYIVLTNPDASAGDATKEGDSLVIDTHAVKMTLTPAGADQLTLVLSGELFEEEQSVTLKRVDETQYADASVRLGVSVIKKGLEMWKAGGGKKYPPAKEVAADGVLGQMVRWPTNPFTGGPMEQGDDPGNFTYKRLDGGAGFSLIGHLSNGETIGD